MDSQENNSVFVLDNSPIELIVIGTLENATRILIKTEGTKLDLLGFAMTISEKGLSSGTSIFDFFSKVRNLNAISSYAIEPFYDLHTNFYPNSDPAIRKTSLSLAWVGLCSYRDRQKIEETFNRYAADLQRALSYNMKEQIEISLAPTILYCSEADTKRKRSIRAQLFFIIFYLLLLASVGLYFYIRKNF